MTPTRWRGGAGAALVAVLLTGPPANAAFLALTESQREEALLVGERGATRESFDAEWRVDNGAGDTLTVVTPFYRLVVAGRHAAFRNEPVKTTDQERMVSELRDRLMFNLQLHGAREDFARHYKPRLVVGDREVEPALVQNGRTALRLDTGVYRAECTYTFPNKDIAGDAKLVLTVRDAGGQSVTRFAIDLATMR